MLQKLVELFPMINCLDNCVEKWNDRYIVYRDILMKAVIKSLLCNGVDESSATAEATEKVDQVLECLDNIIVFDSWAAEPSCLNCSECPAFDWVVHHDGIHTCRLGFGIEEKNGTAHPIEKCIRPKTVGACYLIAKALNRPGQELLAGKLSRQEYDRYILEKEAAEC